MFCLASVPLPLPPREHTILETLLFKSGKTVSKKMIADALFAMSEPASVDAIEVYIHRLRRKLERSGVSIVTLRGLGYILQHDDALN